MILEKKKGPFSLKEIISFLCTLHTDSVMLSGHSYLCSQDTCEMTSGLKPGKYWFFLVRYMDYWQTDDIFSGARKRKEYSFKCPCRFCILKSYLPICQCFTCKTCSTAVPLCSLFLLSIQTAIIQSPGLSLLDIFVYHLVQWSASDQECHKQSGQTGNDMPVWAAVLVEEYAGRAPKPCWFDQGARAFTKQKATACLISTPTTTDTAAQRELWVNLLGVPCF